MLRSDTPILTKNALSKKEQSGLDEDIENFIRSMPSVEQKFKGDGQTKKNESKSEALPPVRTATQSVHINTTKSASKTPASVNFFYFSSLQSVIFFLYDSCFLESPNFRHFKNLNIDMGVFANIFFLSY